jgi:hypothetical protein
MIAEWNILVRFSGLIRGDTIIQHAKIENATCAVETSNGVRKDSPDVSSYRLHLVGFHLILRQLEVMTLLCNERQLIAPVEWILFEAGWEYTGHSE